MTTERTEFGRPVVVSTLTLAIVLGLSVADTSENAVANLTKAMLAADKPKLEALVADQLSYGHSGGVVQDKAVFIDVIASKKTIYKSIELSKQTVAVDLRKDPRHSVP